MDEVAFYIPREHAPPPGMARAMERGERFSLKAGGAEATERAWVYQTFVRLRASGFPCRLVHEVPRSGVLVAFVDSFDALPTSLRDDVFFVCVVADSSFHPFANWHVVQNPRQARRFPHSTFLPHWPQPFLQPRDPERGSAFENVYYYGKHPNLAPPLRSERWRERLGRETGLRFRLRGPEQWHDYRDADAVVAVRSFEEPAHDFLHKPATKLYNAWLAGVPAVCGKESALRAERSTEHDYLEVRSPEETIRALRFLKNHPGRVRAMRNNAARRAKNHTVEVVRERWRAFLKNTVQPQYEQWRKKSPLRRSVFHFRRRVTMNRYWSRLFRGGA
jgi:hypothetical protein